ncbi:DUF4386 domain-containing protein [Jeotgalibacillus salarius]|nr:DUF4386 domain-containing protein [Jeotgalibacillus salarius]
MRSMHMSNQQIHQKAAVYSGVSLLIMTLAAFFAQGYVHSSLVVEGGPSATLANIQSSQLLFRLEILGWVIIIVTDLIVSWGFYQFLKPFHSGYALLAGGLRLIYTAILTIAVVNLISADQAVTAVSASQQVMNSIMSFETIWSLGLIVFGVHLTAVGAVALKTAKIPKVISTMLIMAGISYSLIHFMYNFIPEIAQFTGILELALMAPMFIGELSFGIWLLVKGRKLIAD